MAEQPQTRQQHPVPQEVFGVKFKLVGDLTVRQFGVLAIFGFFAFVFFSTNIFLPFRILLTLIFALGGIAFAFVPVQDMPLDQWIGAFFRAIYSPTSRVWIKSAEAPDFLTLEIPKFDPTPEPGVTAEESRRKLSAFIAGVRGEGELSPLDLEEKQYLEGIRTIARQMVPAAPAVAVAEAPAEPSGPPIEVP
ncbi:MAG: PrgI family protein, partial [bacterium]|nr:PrgI family protein [bacterium]